MKRKIADFLRECRRVVVLSHRDPDGDAVGSAAGMARILSDAGIEATAVLPGGVPPLYAFVPDADRILAEPPAEAPDVFVVVDATSPSRLGDLERALRPGVPVVNIDHHPDNSRFGDHVWVDSDACATALMIEEWAASNNFPIGREAAELLYVGIVTDTGRFTYANTDARCLEAAGRLVRLGADPHRIATNVYEKSSPASLQLLGCALTTLDFREGGAVAALHVTRRMLEETGARDEDADGFSTYARSIEGVRVGIFFRETKEGAVKVSFRSNEGVEIHDVARRFGGGGHPRASGARVPGPIEEAKEAVLRAVTEHLHGNGG
jgi:phosphoesterase RecJ-like protein